MPARIPFPILITLRGRVRWQLTVPRAIAGRRQRLLFASKQEALGKRAEFESALLGGFREFSALSARDQAAVVRCLTRLGSAADLETAVDEFLARKVKVGVAVATAIDECLQAKAEANLSEAYLERLGIALEHVREMIGSVSCSDVTPAQIEEFLRSRHSWSVETRRSYLQSARTFFDFARRRRYCDNNPASAVEMPRRDNREPGILTIEECRKLLTALLDFRDMIPFVTVSLFSGLRPSEAARVVKEHVHGAELDVRQTKVRSIRHRFVTVHPTLAAWLALATGWGFNRRRFRAVRKAAGITWTPDCLRHSFASYHLASGKDAGKTAHEMGHHGLQMLFANYRNRVSATAAKEFWELTPEKVQQRSAD